MTPQSVVDNDILIKLSCFALGNDLLHLYEDSGIGVLDSARYVVAKQIEKSKAIRDPGKALQQWATLLGSVEELEPSEGEVSLATAIEDYALTRSLPLDGGESLLCSIAIHRGLLRVVTGDKRAIEGLESALSEPALRLDELRNKIHCLEQILSLLIASLGVAEVKKRICDEPSIDRTASICFSCASNAAFDAAGLESYVDALRRVAQSLLWQATDH